MLKRSATLISLFVLSACASVSNETFSPIVVDGDTYQLRTRTIEGPNGAYETTSARVDGIYYLCRINSPGDCEAAVRRGLEELPF
ncbi:hypothetical protein ACOTTU_15550 [Roseobacter sp. EG26]|uniref:hypothetical protein n=1 Tax=Roseobacter sp. EG26 TaxID=3412477 RepID=UPI003CE454BA